MALKLNVTVPKNCDTEQTKTKTELQAALQPSLPRRTTGQRAVLKESGSLFAWRNHHGNWWWIYNLVWSRWCSEFWLNALNEAQTALRECSCFNTTSTCSTSRLHFTLIWKVGGWRWRDTCWRLQSCWGQQRHIRNSDRTSATRTSETIRPSRMSCCGFSRGPAFGSQTSLMAWWGSQWTFVFCHHCRCCRHREELLTEVFTQRWNRIKRFIVLLSAFLTNLKVFRVIINKDVSVN